MNYTEKILEEFDRLNPKPTRDDSVDDEEWEMIKNGWEITIDFRDFLTSSIAQAVAEERERMREKIENAIKYTNWSHSVGSHSDDRGGDSDVECTCKEDEARYQTVAYKNTLSFLSSPDSNPKCVCGEQDILGGAEVEIGGVCHRPKNPCYIIEPLTDK